MIHIAKKYIGRLCAITLCLGMLAIACACSSDSNSSKDIHETSDSRVTYEGKILTIALYENGSTGYLWNITKSGTALVELDDEYVSDADEDKQIVGAGGTHTYRFQGESAGITTINLVYSQPWEPKDTDERFIVEVLTEEDGTIKEVAVNSES